MLRYSATVTAVLIALSLGAPAIRAQDRAEQPPPSDRPTDEPKFVEKLRRYAEENRLVERLSGDGFYPRIGGLNPGSGLAGGPGFRNTRPWLHTDVSAAISTKLYLGADVRARWLQLFRQRLEVWTEYRFRDDTKDPFYGLGLTSSPDARTNYAIQTHDVMARVIARPYRWLRLGADTGYLSPAVRRGRDSAIPSIEQVFTDASAPGLSQQPKFAHSNVFVEVDSRDARGFPRRGGVYRAAYGFWNDRTLNHYDFRRFDVEGSQFFSLAPKDVVAVRLLLNYTNNAPGSQVPFYFLPFLGGGDTLRGFREFRFRDENAGAFNAEIRHQVHSMVHVAAFFDAGKVARNWQDIVPSDLKTSYGVGVRAGTDSRMFFRCDFGFGGDEGVRVFVKFTPAF